MSLARKKGGNHHAGIGIGMPPGMMAEYDARTLAEAEVIKKDAARLKAAGKAAEVMKKEAEDTVKGLAKIARLGK